MELIAQYIDDLRRGTVIPGGNLDTIPCIRCTAHARRRYRVLMVDRSTAVCVEDQITRRIWEELILLPAPAWGTRMMRQADAEVCHNRHRKSRTIRTICQAGTAPYIRIPEELSRVVCDLRTLEEPLEDAFWLPEPPLLLLLLPEPPLLLAALVSQAPVSPQPV